MSSVSALLALALCVLLLCRAGYAGESQTERVLDPADQSLLLERIAKQASHFTTLTTDFIQEKEMAMFTGKLVLKGRIAIQKPNKIAWHVDSPIRYSVLITDKLIRQWDEDTDKVQEISLAKNPIFQNVLKQLTVWFSGEYGTLLEDNTMRLVKRDPFVIEFTPRITNMSRKIIKHITIVFREDQTYLKQIRIEELSGDVTTIYFSNTRLNAPLDKGDFQVRPLREQGSRMIMHGNNTQRAGACADDPLGDLGSSYGVQGHV